MIDDSRRSKGNEKLILEARNALIEQYLAAWFNVVSDDTNFWTVHEATFKEIAKKYKAKFESKFIDTPLNTCLVRDSERANSVGEEVIMRMYNEFLKPKRPVIEFDSSLPNCIICDIDGTLADGNWRNPYDREHVDKDLIVDQVKFIVNNYAEYGEVVITTWRMEQARKMTEARLKKHSINYSKLFMRKDEDLTKDSKIKQAMYEDNLKWKYNVEFVIDDRPQVVDMRRSLGLFVFDVNQTWEKF